MLGLIRFGGRRPGLAALGRLKSSQVRSCSKVITLEREAMKSYWGEDHGAPTLENMMLSSDASVMDALERPEILSELPSLSGKKVLELGAGIGRFSGPLALKAKEVVAVDFVASSSEENRRANAHHSNLTVLTADATTLEQPESSFDLVFSNWLLMYLTDEELKTFAKNALHWVKPGGYLFFRESCFHASGNTAGARKFNPTKYRDPETYSQVFSEMRLDDGSRFQLLATNCVDSYADMKDNVNQMWFRWVKVDGSQENGQFMNPSTGQFSPAHILRYEKIYGRDYVCTGGHEITKQIGEKCAETLKPGARVLDIGCALGGTMLHLAEAFPDVYFHGHTGSGELAALFAGRHVRRPANIRKRVSHEVATEVADLRYPPNSFDLVIMRESLMYVKPQDKAVLLRMVSRMLRPGGQILIIDYAFGTGQGTGDLLGRPTPEAVALFGQYVKDSDYSLMEPARTAELLGRYFTIDEQSDKTDEFIRYMDEGLAGIEASFGTQAPARQIAEEAAASCDETLANLREELTKKVTAALPKGACPTAAADAADAAMETVSLQLAAIDAESQRCASDHALLTHKWTMKRNAAEAGALRWVLFSATKADNNAAA